MLFRWLVPSVAKGVFSGARDGDVVLDRTLSRRSNPVTQLAAVQHEDVEQTLVFQQASVSTGGPLAEGRYRR